MDSVSVIIPTFNRAATLEKAIKSALNQSYPVLEVLVCDDGSTDNSRAIVSSINDSRVKWIDCGSNGRPAIPRNKGISLAKGNWIAFLDSDDEWFPEKTKEQLEFAAKKQLKAICCNANKIDSFEKNTENYLTYPKNTIEFRDLIFTNFVICSSAIIHQSLFLKTSGFPEQKNLRAIEDYALWLRIATQNHFGYLSRPLLYYLDNSTNSIRTNQPNIYLQKINVLKNLLHWMVKNKIYNLNHYSLLFLQLLLTKMKQLIQK